MQDTLLNFGRVRSLVDTSVLRANEGHKKCNCSEIFWWKKTWEIGCMEMYGARKFTYPQVV